MGKVCTNNLLKLVKLTLWSLSGSSSNSFPPSVTHGWFQFSWISPLSFLEMSAERTSTIFPKQIFRDSSFCGWTRVGTPHMLTGCKLQIMLWFSVRIWESHILFSRADSWITHFCRTTAAMCHQKCSRKAEGVSFVPRAGKAKCQQGYSFLRLPFLQWIGTLFIYFYHRQSFMPDFLEIETWPPYSCVYSWGGLVRFYT